MVDLHPLRVYREKHGIPVAAIAAAVGTTRQTIYRVENGTQEPSISLIRRLVKATKDEVSADQFLQACLAASNVDPTPAPTEGAAA